MSTHRKIQRLIYKLEIGGGRLWLRVLLLVAAGLALAGIYDLTAYRGFNSPEAMDAAQVARHLAEGQGYTTDFIRPFSLYLVAKHHLAAPPGSRPAGNLDFAQINRPHPDLANPPGYPAVLAGLFAFVQPDWQVQTHKQFWAQNEHFVRYAPEFFITLLNQLLLLAGVVLTFLLAKTIFDSRTALLAAGLTLVSDELWKFSISGQSTLLLLVIFLGLLWCLAKVEMRARSAPSSWWLFVFALAAGALTGGGLLTRYAFGWVMVPVVFFLAGFGGPRRSGLVVVALLAFAAVVGPWLGRNLEVSGTLFGTAGYAGLEGTGAFPGARLMQSLNPDLKPAYRLTPYLYKFLENARNFSWGDLLRLGGGWLGILFFAGFLLRLPDPGARRLRYFTLACLGVFFGAQTLGRTQWSNLVPDINSENLLVLLTPLVVIFGVAAFQKLIDRLRLSSSQLRSGLIGLLALLASLPLIVTLLPPKISPVAFPPYYPPEIQSLAGWMRSDELMMSDIPWAVAWYGRRQCTWLTPNAQSDFFALNDNLKPVRALYLTRATLDRKLFSECLEGGTASWGNFVLRAVAANDIPPGFPLRVGAPGLLTGLFLTDRQRWPTE